jgi:hypothetical protein
MDELWLFHGPHQKGLAERFASMGERVILVPIEQRGKNSLDFHLSFYLGYVAARHPDAQLVVVANDKGYEPMVGHAKELGFSATQVGFMRTARKTARTPRKTPAGAAREAAPRKAAPASKRSDASAKNGTPVTAPKEAAAASRGRVRKAPGESAARTTHAAVAPGKTPAASGRKASAARPAASPVAPASDTPAVAKKAATRKSARTAGPAGPTTAAAATDAVARLTEALRKMGVRRPRKVGPLRRALASLLGVAVDGNEVQSALERLSAARVIALGDTGSVSYHL